MVYNNEYRVEYGLIVRLIYCLRQFIKYFCKCRSESILQNKINVSCHNRLILKHISICIVKDRMTYIRMPGEDVSVKGTELLTWKYTKWLVVTSLGFMIPAFYAYQNQVYFLSGLLVVTSLISANYWRFPIQDSLSHKVDLVFAKISFSIFFIHGYLYVRTIPYVITTYPGVVCIGYCYYMSCKTASMNDPNWNKYHIAFHLFMIYSQWAIIDSIISQKIDSI